MVHIRKKWGKRRRMDLLFYSIILAWPVIQFLVFYVFVNLNSVLLAFKEYSGDGTFNWAGLDNFKKLFNDFGLLTVYKTAFSNSILLFLTGTFISISLGLLFAYYIYKKGRYRNVFKVILFLPSIIPAIAMVTMFKQMCDGAFTEIATIFGLNVYGLLSDRSTAFATVIFYTVWIGFGPSLLLYLGGMNGINESVSESAQIDGAGYFSEFWRITLPMVFPTISTFIIVGIGSIFINQGNIYSFYGLGAEEYVQTIGYYLYKETTSNVMNSSVRYPSLSAFGLLLTLITVPIMYGARFLMNKFGPSAD